MELKHYSLNFKRLGHYWFNFLKIGSLLKETQPINLTLNDPAAINTSISRQMLRKKQAEIEPSHERPILPFAKNI